MKRANKRQIKQQAQQPASPPARPPEGGHANAAAGIDSFPSDFLRRGWVFVLFLVLATAIAYQPVWHAGFIFDDEGFVTQNPMIERSDGLYQFWCTTAAPDYFPMTSTTLWLEWRLWGDNPLGYHLVNVLLHVVSSVLLWQVLKRLHIPGAMLAAAFFALHPVNVESAAWITERKNTLAMFFYLLTLLGFLKFEDTGRRRWYWGAVGLFAAALLSKTAVVMLPVVLLAVAWWRRGWVERKDLLRGIPFFAVAAILGLVTIWFQSHRAIASDIVRTDNFASRLAGAGWAVWFYLYKAFWPFDLDFLYPRWQIDATNVLSYVPGSLILLGLAACWWKRNGWGRAIFFASGYFVVMLLPVLGFVNIYWMKFSLVADHWQYFAIIGPLALGAALFVKAVAAIPAAYRWLGPALGGVLLFWLAVLTWSQCCVYVDAETLWRTTITRSPRMVLAYNNLGTLLFHKGQEREAIQCFKKALEIQPDYAQADYNLGAALAQNGNYNDAISHYKKSLTNKPDALQAEALNNLGNALLQKGQLDEAILNFQKALALQPAFAFAENNLGIALLQKGLPDEAISHFQKALAIQPDFTGSHYNIGYYYLQKGRLDDALAEFQKELAIKPGFSPALNQLARIAWLWATSPDPAVRNGSKALDLARQLDRLANGPDPMIATIMAAAYAESGRFSDALANARHALELASARHDDALASSIQSQLKCYQSNSPFRDAQVSR